MANNKTISFLLGSGFSIKAGLPNSESLNSVFIKFSIKDFDNLFDGINISFNKEEIRILGNLLDAFALKHSDFNYEEFYDYFYFERLNNFNRIDLLINLLVYRKLKENEVKLNDYLIFLTTIKEISNKNKVDIFTLNHDILLEEILLIKNVEFHDGFSLINDVPVFDNNFNSKINIVKLHGSINWFYYYEPNITPKDPNNRFPEKKIFKSTVIEQFCENHENINNLIPLFLTGKNVKSEKSKNNIYLNQLLSQFKDNIGKSEELIIIGYSYGDAYINMILQSEIEKSKSIKRIININPNVDFPYSFNNCVVFNYKEYDWLEKFPLILNC